MSNVPNSLASRVAAVIKAAGAAGLYASEAARLVDGVSPGRVARLIGHRVDRGELERVRVMVAGCGVNFYRSAEYKAEQVREPPGGVHGSGAQRALDHVAQMGARGVLSRELAAEMGWQSTHAKAVLQRLVASGALESRAVAGRKPCALYRLPQYANEPLPTFSAPAPKKTGRLSRMGRPVRAPVRDLPDERIPPRLARAMHRLRRDMPVWPDKTLKQWFVGSRWVTDAEMIEMAERREGLA